MDLSIILTYRCDSKCSMCHIWKYPTIPTEEISLKTLEKLPNNFDNLNITGGEPTLRNDLVEIVDLVYPKARIPEINSNGLHTEKLIPIIKKYKNIKLRYSLDGFDLTNDKIRGEDDGFKKKVEGMKQLKELGGTDLGFATVIQDDNVHQLMDLYKLTIDMGLELSTSTLHNGFQFLKGDNYFYERVKVARQIEELIVAMLKTNSIKNWFRAYLNLGLIEKILGHPRLIPCTAATDFIFIDPWSNVYACNVRPDLLMGNLENQSWDEIVNGEKAKIIRNLVSHCTQNCWMVTTARVAMRNPLLPFFPKFKPFKWVVENKFKVMLGRKICFEKYINYNIVTNDVNVIRRKFYLGVSEKRVLQKKTDEHYTMAKYFNN